MRRFTLIVIGSLALPSVALAQATGGNSAPSALVAANPILADVARTNGNRLESILRELLANRDGTQTSPARQGTWTTDTETAELDANPDFKRAFERNPDATLKLLAEVDQIIAGDPQRASE